MTRQLVSQGGFLKHGVAIVLGKMPCVVPSCGGLEVVDVSHVGDWSSKNIVTLVPNLRVTMS